MKRSEGRPAQLLCSIVALLLATANCLTVDIDTKSMSAYTHQGYRQLPYRAFGVYSKDSFASVWSGHENDMPFVDIELEIEHAPRNTFQVYLYNSEIVEPAAAEQFRSDMQPCMDQGQASGVAVPSGVQDAFLIGGAIARENPNKIRISSRVQLSTTGLYIVTLNSCRFTNLSSTKRILDTSRWEEVSIRGRIIFKNSFGFLPGQSYPLLPIYIGFLVVCFVTLVIFLVFAVKLGIRRLSRYQWVMLSLAAANILCYLVLVVYFSNMNDTGKDNYVLFIFARSFVILRNTVSLLGLFLLCYGWGVNMRQVRFSWANVLICSAGVRFTFALVEFGLQQALSGKHFSSGIGDIHDEFPDTMWRVFRIVGILMDTFYALIAAFALHSTVRRLTPITYYANQLRLFRLTTYALVVASLATIIGFIIVASIAKGPSGTLSETQWRLHWVPEVCWEFLFFSLFTTLSFIWLPTPSSFYFVYGELLPQDVPTTVVSPAAKFSTRRRNVATRPHFDESSIGSEMGPRTSSDDGKPSSDENVTNSSTQLPEHAALAREEQVG